MSQHHTGVGGESFESFSTSQLLSLNQWLLFPMSLGRGWHRRMVTSYGYHKIAPWFFSSDNGIPLDSRGSQMVTGKPPVWGVSRLFGWYHFFICKTFVLFLIHLQFGLRHYDLQTLQERVSCIQHHLYPPLVLTSPYYLSSPELAGTTKISTNSRYFSRIFINNFFTYSQWLQKNVHSLVSIFEYSVEFSMREPSSSKYKISPWP